MNQYEFIGMLVIALGSLGAIVYPLLKAIIKLNATIGDLNTLIKLITKDVKFLQDDVKELWEALNLIRTGDIEKVLERVRELESKYQSLLISCIRKHVGDESEI